MMISKVENQTPQSLFQLRKSRVRFYHRSLNPQTWELQRKPDIIALQNLQSKADMLHGIHYKQYARQEGQVYSSIVKHKQPTSTYYQYDLWNCCNLAVQHDLDEGLLHCCWISQCISYRQALQVAVTTRLSWGKNITIFRAKWHFNSIPLTPLLVFARKLIWPWICDGATDRPECWTDAISYSARPRGKKWTHAASTRITTQVWDSPMV